MTPAQFLRRLRTVLTSTRRDREMDEEMAIHLAMEADDSIRRGLPPDEARRRARQAFGGVERFREEGRDARGIGPARDLSGDIRYGLRVLRRSPMFTAVAVATLALGIGANTAIFSVVNAVVLRPLPFPDTHSLVSVWDGSHSLAEYTYLRDRARTLESVGTYLAGHGVSLSGDGEPARLTSALVSDNFFHVLRVGAVHGRLFEPGENDARAEPVVVLSHALWQSRHGSDPSVVGRQLEIDGVSRKVVGIAPPGFTFPSSETRLWIPLLIDPAGTRCASGDTFCRSGALGMFWGSYGHSVIGRLQPGVTREQARADVLRIGAELQQENPVWRPGMPEYLANVAVSDLRTRLVSDSQGLLFVLLAAVGLVLLLACANVANLLVVRGAMRSRELSVRAALGASPRRLARQLVIENLLLAGIGGLAGLMVAAMGVPVLTSMLTGSAPRLEEVRLDGWVLLFTIVVTTATGLLFGVLPARRLANANASAALSGTRVGQGAPQRRLAAVLVSGQIAIGLMLAVGAGLLVRSLARILDVDPGFATEQVVSARVNPPRARYERDEPRRQIAQQIVERLAAAPGVTATAVTTQLPFDQTGLGMAMWIDGWTTDPNRLDILELRAVSPDFFRTMGIPLRQGRTFNDADAAGAPVAIVSEAAARRFWNGRDPVGGQVRYPWPGWITVVGVAADIHNNDLKAGAQPAIYVPFAQRPQVPFTVVVSSSGEVASVLATIRSVVAGVSAETPLSHERTMASLVEESVASQRAAAILLLSFGALALLLASVGTYGLVAYGVEARRREFAVRIAIGARPSSVVRLVLREGALLTLVGVGVGIIGALAMTGAMRGLLFETAPTDLLTFMAAPLVLGITALLACAVPAWRAPRVDPNGALRE
jgi:predicted permease